MKQFNLLEIEKRHAELVVIQTGTSNTKISEYLPVYLRSELRNRNGLDVSDCDYKDCRLESIQTSFW